MSESSFNSEFYSPDVALQETLELLDWPILCDHLSKFASTTQGKRNCQDLFLPENYETSCTLLTQTAEINQLDESLEGGLNFQGVHDIERIVMSCVKGGIASGEELLNIVETLRAARRLRRTIQDSLLCPVTSALVENVATLPDVERTLGFGIEEGGRVADRASEALQKFRSHLTLLDNQRKDILQKLLRRHSSILQDSVISERYGRPVIALKIGSSDQVPGVVHDSSASGSTIFMEPQVVISLGNQIAEIKSKILAEEKRLLAIWSNLVGENFELISNLCRVLLNLEISLAKARYGNFLRGVLPVISDDENSSFLIPDFRHPLLIWQDHNKGIDSVVPISFEVSQELRVVAITGPNTGGKTIALKSFGLAVLMARCGMFLPCSGKPSFPWCNLVLADIGDEQSLQQNLSTFSGHIVRIRQILHSIKHRRGPAIVLLDEVGAGTDPTEGSAIAIALLKTLAGRARLTIATTHLGELKALKYSDARFENASVAFDSETIRPTYHLQWGIPGRSNALAIAIRLGLDSEVTNFAQTLIAPKGLEDVNQVILGLEDQRERQQKAAEEAAALLGRTELLYEELLAKWDEQRENSRKWREQSRKKFQASIQEGQKEVRELIYRLRQDGADGNTARKAGKRLKELQGALYEDSHPKEDKNEWQPMLGDRVRLLAFQKSGEVISISADGRHVTVLCGLFRSTVKLSDVETIDGRKATIPQPLVKVKTPLKKLNDSGVRTKANTLDVRGLRVHEAEVVVEEGLRNATGKLWVIHGIGTGKLKNGLRLWLQSLPYVEKVTDAELIDGGAGCSVIWVR